MVMEARQSIFRLTHPLTTNDISQPTEQELSHQGADGGGDFYAQILMGGELTTYGDDERTR